MLTILEKSPLKRETMVTVWLALLSFLFLLLFAFDSSPLNPRNFGDSSVYKTMGLGLSQGKVPYRDLFDNKGFYLYLLQALGMTISYSKWGVFILCVLNFTVVLSLFRKIGKLFNLNAKRMVVPFTITLFFLSFTLCGGNLTEEWSLIPILLPLYLFLKHQVRSKGRSPYLYTWVYGVCFGIIAFIRINNACVIVAIVLAMSIIYITKGWFKELAFHILVFLCGLSIAIIPVVAYFYLNSALTAMLHGTFLINLIYMDNFDVGFELIIKNLLRMIPILFLLIYASYQFDKRNNTNLCLFSCSEAVLMTVLFMTGYGFVHYFVILVPVLYLFLVICSALQINKYGYLVLIFVFMPYKGSIALNYKITAFANVVSNSDFLFKKIGPHVTNNERRYETKEAYRILSHIPIDERDSIYCDEVFPHAQSIFLLAHTTPVGKYFLFQNRTMQMDPLVSEEVADYFKHNRPLWIITPQEEHNLLMNRVLEDYSPVYTSRSEMSLGEGGTRKVSLYKRL